jgi:hypothetical protein
METLADHGPTSHRLPVPDLISAALAHQHGCGVIHYDEHFDLMAEHSGLDFKALRIQLVDAGDDGGGGQASPGARQRELKTDFAQLLHQMPSDEAERFLEDVVEEARGRVENPSA